MQVPTTFDKESMETSKAFVMALQELKNLRPQLYYAAEYCEKSYLHNEQKLMVLDNLKEYTMLALVNAVDHLGTVAYKLTGLFEQQWSDVSMMELKVSCLNQRINTCQTYLDIEGLKKQDLLATSQRHHKHYVLPNSFIKNVSIGPQLQTDGRQNLTASNSQPKPQESETNTLDESIMTLSDHEGSEAYKIPNEMFYLQVESASKLPLSAHLRSIDKAFSPLRVSKNTVYRDFAKSPKLQPACNSSEIGGGREIGRPAARSKSLLSVFFSKNKYAKQKRAYM